jgi:alkylation response protein AidB-like acyl-CoA dehydrogenase
MKLEFDAADLAFRDEVRAFVKANLDPQLKRKVELGLRLERADYLAWYGRLHERGWITPAWPVEHGGPGWTPLQRYIFD